MREAVLMNLMIGPGVPMPVPRSVLDALTSVKVITDAGEAMSGFELNFTIDARSPLHTILLLSGGALPPIMRVIVTATVKGVAEVLIDGVMTNHRSTQGPDGRVALTIMGKDLAALMAYFPPIPIPYPAIPAEVRVLTILAKYAVFGVIPLVIPSVLVDVPLPTDVIPRQQGTDLEYVKALAEQVGYVFYMKPGPQPGMSFAYWGPEIKVGAPQPALTLDLEYHRNVASLSFQYDAEAAELPIVWIQEQVTKAPIPIPIPDITPLNPPLALVPPIPRRFPSIDETAKYSPVRAALIGIARAAKRADVVTGSGTLDVLRYGRLLRARELVGVRGAGTAFDGLYYVKSVTHEIQRGSYNQSFTLKRNGLVSNIPKVPV
jgi:hypothetical protein